MSHFSPVLITVQLEGIFILSKAQAGHLTLCAVVHQYSFIYSFKDSFDTTHAAAYCRGGFRAFYDRQTAAKS